MTALVPVLWLLVGCTTGFADPSRQFGEPLPDRPAQPDLIHRPAPMAVWHAPLSADPDLPSQATCDTCHGPSPERTVAGKPDEAFHTTIEIQHGEMGCDQCHDRNRTLLHRADGTTFDFSEVMTLCGQCHGPILRDYEHGAHGGVQGHWDRTQGPRIRNNCIDCHLPHAPAIGAVMSTFPVRDRYYGEQ